MRLDHVPYMLVVEDSDEDFAALERVLAKNCTTQIPLKRCIDGDDALDLVYSKGIYASQSYPPSLIMLDLNLPGTDGREVLMQLKQDTRLKMIPVIVFTTSSDPKDIKTCYQYGVNSYITKPMNLERMKTSVCLFIKYWFEVAVLPTSAMTGH